MSNEEQAAARDILKYLQKQPNVKNTSDGIAKYWIFQQRLEENFEIVLTAIKYLVKEGFLEEVRKEDKESYYRLNKEKMNEISSAVEKLQHASDC